MGDQLESVNTPRARAVEAQKLMNHFAELMRPEPATDGILNDPDKVNILDILCIIILLTFCFFNIFVIKIKFSWPMFSKYKDMHKAFFLCACRS